MRIQELLIENSNRPKIQQEIKDAAEKGASGAGFNIMVDLYKSAVVFIDQETHDNQEAAVQAAMEAIKETVNLD